MCPPLRVAGPVQGLTKNLGLDIGHVGRCTKTLCTAQSTDIVQCAHKVHVFCGTQAFFIEEYLFYLLRTKLLFNASLSLLSSRFVNFCALKRQS